MVLLRNIDDQTVTCINESQVPKNAKNSGRLIQGVKEFIVSHNPVNVSMFLRTIKDYDY